MNGDRQDGAISIQLGSGRSLIVPEPFFNHVGDIVIDRFDEMPTGQAVRGARSLLRPHAASEHSPESYPTVATTDFIMAMADREEVPVTVVEYQVRDVSPFMASSPCRNPGIAEFIASRSQGIIEYSGNVSAAEIISDVCLASPQSPVLVVTPHTKQAERLARSVFEIAPDLRPLDLSLGCLPDGRDPDEYDEEIGTYRLVFTTVGHAESLGRIIGTGISRFPIVMYTQAARANDLMHQGITHALDSAFRLFGLHCTSEKMSHDQIGHAMQVFGPWWLEIPSSGYCRSAIYVCMVPNNQAIRNLTARESNAVKVISHIQTCSNRNELIARTALNFVEGRFAGADYQQFEGWLNATRTSGTQSVVIICRTFRHAARLASNLLGWRVFSPGGSPDRVGLSSVDRKRIEDCATTDADDSRIICPLDYLDVFLATADPEILINAAGGSHAPTFPEFWLSHRTGESRKRLVVDFWDNNHEVTRRHSRCRRKEYAEQQIMPMRRQISPDRDLQLVVARRFLSNSVRPPQSRGSNDNER